jgi:glutamine synthetase
VISFVDRNELWSKEQGEATQRLMSAVAERKLDVVRFSFPDQHGILRGKTVTVAHLEPALNDGVRVTTTLLAKDLAHRTVFPVFTHGGGFGRTEMQGGADAIMVADPTTFRVLPWSPNTGWVLCDLYFPDGRPVPFATRQLCRRIEAEAVRSGFEPRVGLEVEFHIFKLCETAVTPDAAGQPGEPPAIELVTRGYQYLTESRYDSADALLDHLRSQLVALDLPLRSLEIEMGPSQFEFTFAPLGALAASDAMVLFRSAVKQVCHRMGYHATFMCRPRIPRVVSSGWHLHQSLRRMSDATNAFTSENGDAPLASVGMRYLAGLLQHAPAATAFAAPTINAYKRYQPYSLAPDRMIWSRDNRGAMLRVIGTPHDPTARIENRVGEPGANPYLYIGSQLASGLDGVRRALDPAAAIDSPYEGGGERLPRTLSEALAALRADADLRAALGDEFVSYYVRLKEAEVARFNLEVTEWEHREYFDL